MHAKNRLPQIFGKKYRFCSKYRPKIFEKALVFGALDFKETALGISSETDASAYLIKTP